MSEFTASRSFKINDCASIKPCVWFVCLLATVSAERTWYITHVDGQSDSVAVTWSAKSLDGETGATSCGECNSLDHVIQLAGDGDVVQIDGRRRGVAYSLCHWAANRRRDTSATVTSWDGEADGDAGNLKSIIIRGVNGKPRLLCVDELMEVNRPDISGRRSDPYGNWTDNDNSETSNNDDYDAELPPTLPLDRNYENDIESGQGRDPSHVDRDSTRNTSKSCIVEWNNVEWFDVELHPSPGCDLVIINSLFVEATVNTEPGCDRINVTISGTVFRDDVGKSPRTNNCRECSSKRYVNHNNDSGDGGATADQYDHHHRRQARQGRHHADAIVLSCMTSLTLLVKDSELKYATLVVDGGMDTNVRVSRTKFGAVRHPMTSYLSGLRLTLGRRHADVEIVNCSFTGRKHSTMVNSIARTHHKGIA